MLAYDLRNILELIPEAMPLVKQASLEEDFPMNNKDSVCASYLRMNYLVKVAGQLVDVDQYERVKKAATLYGVRDTLDELSRNLKPIEKKASLEKTASFECAVFEAQLQNVMLTGIEKVAQEAATLHETYGDMVSSDDVLRYAGELWLNKEAAVLAISNRYYASENVEFVKMAKLAAEVDPHDKASVKQIAKTITVMDKQAGLDLLGFNFYKEGFTKQAAEFTIKLAGETVPYSKIARCGKERISSLVGNDVGSAITGSAPEDKAVLESLPRDTQLILKNVLRNV